MLKHARIIERLCLGLPLKDVGWVCIVREGPYCSVVKCILLLRCVNKAQPTSKSISGGRKVMGQRVERQWSEMYRTVPGASWPYVYEYTSGGGRDTLEDVRFYSSTRTSIRGTTTKTIQPFAVSFIRTWKLHTNSEADIGHCEAGQMQPMAILCSRYYSA